jgi:GntR family transcriptional regulator/MocR family aminotransferase
MQIQISLLLDRSRADTLTTQLVSQLRDAIRVGRIAPGVRLPSSRRLSEQLGIGRNTVVRAYETLEIECYVEARPASGMFATVPPFDPGPVRRFGEPLARPPSLSRTGAPAGGSAEPRTAVNRGRLSFDFAPGVPDAGLFPLKTWRRLLQTCLSRGGLSGMTRPGDLFGLASLRSAIATHLGAARGIVAEPGQIIIVSGVREAIAIATRLFVSPGSVVCVENPCYRPAAAAFQAAGAELRGLPVDTAGMLTEDLPEAPTALLYVTPAHQYPTGHTLSQPRREQLASWARRSGAMILEDDHGASFRYEGGAPLAVAAYAPDRTLHYGGFSQSLGGGTRLGYLVVPPALVEPVRAAKSLLSGGCSWLEQAAVAEWVLGGGYASHVMRMRVEYRDRRDHLLDALGRNFGDLDVSGTDGGLHVFWQLPPGVPDAATVEALGRRARVGVYSMASGGVHYTGSGALARRGLILGYAGLTPKQIEQGVARLSDAVDDALDGHTIGLSDLLVYRPLPSASGPSASGPSASAFGPPRRRQLKPAPRFRQQPALSIPGRHRAASGHATEPGPGKPMTVVTGLYHYPIKGLSPQPLKSVAVEAGRPFPFDRVFALARPGVAVTAEEPKWAKKGLFVMLMLDEALASVRTHLDEKTLLLTIKDGERPLLSADLSDAAGRRDVEAFFHRLAPTLRAPPVLVRARDGHFMDKPDNVISLINLATVRALEQQWGQTIDPLRFRANIYVDGAPPWDEFNWVGNDVRLGDAIFRVDRRNGRCGATNVDPATGRRDLDIPGSLRKAFGHKDLGVYLVARSSAGLTVGDAVAFDTPRGWAPPGGRKPAAQASAPAAGRDAFICRGCYFVYSETHGLPLAGIAPGTRFTDLPHSWRCPDCGTEKATFRPHLAAS